MLKPLIDKHEKLIVGLMSGTSADGIDAALVRVSGSGLETQLALLGFVTLPFADAERRAILTMASSPTASIDDLTRLNFFLAGKFALAAQLVVEQAGFTLGAVDLIGSHGQTIRHLPQPHSFLGESITGTLQIGDPSVIAKLTGVTTVGDFRPADMAVGGQGAPLVPYFDYLFFRSEHLNRVVLNLGGISNVTLLPAGCASAQVQAFDTGPGNCLIDSACRKLIGTNFDAEGAVAARGTIHEVVLDQLLCDDYFHRPPPKSTGLEYFGQSFLNAALERLHNVPAEDVVMTLTALTARSVVLSVERFAGFVADEWVVSGGGALNPTLMRLLADQVAAPIKTTDAYGIPLDAKEAICFAVLANETISGRCTNLPSATGADYPVILGKICF